MLTRQPVQRDVVEDVVPGEMARGLPVDESAGDLVVTVRVVVEHPACQGDGSIQQGVADRLRPRHLLEEVAEAGRPEHGKAPAQVGERFVVHPDMEGTDYGCCRCVDLVFHTRSPLCCYMTEWPCDGAAR
ncbi:MAG TPA: hypothetical protein VFN02_00130 [Ktedonobacteraceae bacterium]|nr:hypothetical protein [Ktedonobacteraceae bacterium]